MTTETEPEIEQVDEFVLDNPQQPDTNESKERPNPLDFDEPVELDDDIPASEGSADEGDPDEEPETAAAEPAPEEPETPETAGDGDPEAEPAEPDPADALLAALDLSEEVYETDIVKALGSVKELIAAQRDEIKALKASAAQIESERAQQSERQWFDTFDAEVTKRNIPDMGAGTRDSLSEEQFTARKALLEEMNIISAGLAAAKKPALPLPQLIDKALGSLGKAPAPKAPAKPAPAPVTRPGRRPGADNLSPEERAVRNLKSKMAEYQGMSGGEEDTFE